MPTNCTRNVRIWERAESPSTGLRGASSDTFRGNSPRACAIKSRVESSTQGPFRVTSQHSRTETGVPNRCACIIVANFSNEPLVVPKATVLGIAEEISEPLVDSINAGCKSDADSTTKPRRRKKHEASYNKLLKGKLDNLSHEDRQIIEPSC